jgi:hypothetical protein
MLSLASDLRVDVTLYQLLLGRCVIDQVRVRGGSYVRGCGDSGRLER